MASKLTVEEKALRYNKITEAFRKRREQLKGAKVSKNDLVNIDIAKTTKSMFYTDVETILINKEKKKNV